jgi:crotonobetainyl-CoA:carnitine CoA-transferase CaiB-like acyl-CoA transferase
VSRYAAEPLERVRVVEASLGTSAVGAGLAGHLPGALLRDLGADVVRVQSARQPTLDAGVEFARAWDRGKEVIDVDDEDAAGAAATIGALAREADVLVVSGREELV